MFSYVPKDLASIRGSFYSSYPTAQVATIEELERLCKSGQVDRVIIPMTYTLEGYGADLISLANSASIKRDYGRRVKEYGHELSISAWQFMKYEEFREIIEKLQNDYPLYDDEAYSMLESERHEEFMVDEIYYATRQDEALPDWTVEDIREILHSTVEPQGWQPDGTWSDTRLEWWDIVSTDNDGLTPYMKDEEFAAFLELFKARARELGKLQ